MTHRHTTKGILFSLTITQVTITRVMVTITMDIRTRHRYVRPTLDTSRPHRFPPAIAANLRDRRVSIRAQVKGNYLSSRPPSKTQTCRLKWMALHQLFNTQSQIDYQRHGNL
ncbi:hypothetical protein RMSM_05713 [Rhodopirellula maiorica SM1]|uniref:Uncharacterized protein n=1 Tax=Rhodopirellula maiorica SM1 TaxID=1265738 RepID=M5RPQ7_9BACT|nr:hypothetical protein [Rhodopirellula maiorica]EMI17362.1 hypothetical protein RMSM_05713 [Rhodopirellula maiorica SM1]